MYRFITYLALVLSVYTWGDSILTAVLAVALVVVVIVSLLAGVLAVTTLGGVLELLIKCHHAHGQVAADSIGLGGSLVRGLGQLVKRLGHLPCSRV